MQKIKKILRADSEKKMLLTNGLTEKDATNERTNRLTNRLTDNTELIGPFPSRVQFKMILCQLHRFVYFSLESDSYLQFS